MYMDRCNLSLFYCIPTSDLMRKNYTVSKDLQKYESLVPFSNKVVFEGT